MAPSEGTPRDVAGPVIDMLFPPGSAERGSRSPRSPAPTARRPPRACWRTSSSWPATRVGLTTTDGVYIDGERTVAGDMTGPVAARDGAARSAGRRGGAGDGARRPAARGHGLPASATSARCSTSQSDHLGLKGVETLEQLAEVKRIVVEVARDMRGAQRRRPARACKMADHTDGQAHLLRHDEPDGTSWCASTSAPAAAACVLEAGHQRPDDHALRHGRPHPAAVDAPDPGDARGPRAAQRAERDVRRGDGVHAWASSSRTSARACAPSTPRSSRRPGRMNVFDEHPFKVHPRLRPQRRRGGGDGRPGAAARRQRPPHRACWPAPGDRRDEDIARRSPHRGAAPSTTTSCRRDDDAARPRSPTRCRSMHARRAAAARGVPAEQHQVIPDEQAGDRRRAAHGRSPATCCWSSPTR